jgi:F-type H+-transporting ATPase subunit a
MISVLALSFSVAILIGVTILGLKIHKLAFFSLFVPTGTPLPLVPLLVSIELISYLARAVSLGIRLAANMISGHILLKILSTFIWKFMISTPIAFVMGFIPMILFTALVGLELAVAILQAIVFVILTSSYIRDAIYLH